MRYPIQMDGGAGGGRPISAHLEICEVLARSVGFADVDAHGIVLRKVGELSGWLPPVGSHVSACIVLAELWPEIEATMAGPEKVFCISDFRDAASGIGDFLEANISWLQTDRRFYIATYSTSRKVQAIRDGLQPVRQLRMDMESRD